MTEERKVEEDKKVKSKLRPNTEAFKPEAVIPNNQPYIPKEWENNVMLTNDQQSFNPMVYNMLAGFGNELAVYQNQKYEFINDFSRLDNYNDIEKIRNSFPALSTINVDSFDPARIPMNSKFYMIRSTTHDDIHKSMKYGIWASSENNNHKFEEAYQAVNNANPKGKVFLFYRTVNLNTSCGVAVMETGLDGEDSFPLWWNKHKWKGTFRIRWLYVKNIDLVTLNMKEGNKMVHELIDGSEISQENGIQLLKTFKNFENVHSIFNIFPIMDMREDKLMDYRTNLGFEIKLTKVIRKTSDAWNKSSWNDLNTGANSRKKSSWNEGGSGLENARKKSSWNEGGACLENSIKKSSWNDGVASLENDNKNKKPKLVKKLTNPKPAGGNNNQERKGSGQKKQSEEIKETNLVEKSQEKPSDPPQPQSATKHYAKDIDYKFKRKDNEPLPYIKKDTGKSENFDNKDFQKSQTSPVKKVSKKHKEKARRESYTYISKENVEKEIQEENEIKLSEQREPKSADVNKRLLKKQNRDNKNPRKSSHQPEEIYVKKVESESGTDEKTEEKDSSRKQSYNKKEYKKKTTGGQAKMFYVKKNTEDEYVIKD